jgi:hypothetical protein
MEAALVQLRDANPSSSLPDDWSGPVDQWKGLKRDDGVLKEL